MGSPMNLDTLSDKQLQELERLAKELLLVMRKAKLVGIPLAESLHQLEVEAGEIRRERFDTSNPEYSGY
jgi:hypothetical protein